MAARPIPNLEDVARHAGVSTATVSRCINTPERLREPTRLRVQAAIDALGYTPHFGGQALASNRTNTIGAIIPTMENAIFARGLQAVEERLAEAGVTLLVASSGYDPEREAAQVRTLLGRGVDGLLLIGRDRPAETYRLIQAQAKPLVLAWTLAPPTTASCVGFDNRLAASQLCRCVIEAGHREIAMIAGVTAWNDRARDRIDGVRDALSEYGLKLEPQRLVEAPYSIEDGEAAFRKLFHGPKPTAVICGNDVLAAAAINAASRMGLSVPNDISVTGFDDIDLANVVAPGITTAHVPHRRMGGLAAEFLLRMRNGDDEPTSHEFEVTIVKRGSLSAPNSSAGHSGHGSRVK
ncbi:MAG: LacI family DNA-binding transcriptional regulator [Rhodobacteraceae bacterium]|nr:LacI family DNA-binding transcriptional regulator [Paracoccaceae bacterium]